MKKGKIKNKLSLVVGTTPESYRLSDRRLMKPVCHQKLEDGVMQGSMMVQDLDKLTVSRNKTLTHFVPNNIALMLSVSSKAMNEARRLLTEDIVGSGVELDVTRMEMNKIELLQALSSKVCDYLEGIQTSIVFGYTALEAFVNLSIPDDYKYSRPRKREGVSEEMDKAEIERFLPLKVKLKDILTEVYKTERLERQGFWGKFSTLEKYRNEIIHQKTITHTEFFKDFFKSSVVGVCQSPSDIIHFFYDAHAQENRTNPIWPWMDQCPFLPINRSFDSNNVEVVGNIYEGLHSQRR